MTISDFTQLKDMKIGADLSTTSSNVESSETIDQELRSKIYTAVILQAFVEQEKLEIFREITEFLDNDPPVLLREHQFYYGLLCKIAYAALFASLQLKHFTWQRGLFLHLIAMALIIKGSGMYDFFEYVLKCELKSRRMRQKKIELYQRMARRFNPF